MQCGLRTSVYFLTQFAADFSLYMVLNIPSFVMVLVGFRTQELHQQTFAGLVFLDLITKVAFGFVLIPLVYFIGFF